MLLSVLHSDLAKLRVDEQDDEATTGRTTKPHPTYWTTKKLLRKFNWAPNRSYVLRDLYNSSPPPR